MRDWKAVVERVIFLLVVVVVVCIMTERQTFFSGSIYPVFSLFPFSPETEVVTGHDISKSREKAFKDGDTVNYT